MAVYGASGRERVRSTTSGGDSQTIASWMASRKAEVAQRGLADSAGRQAWTNSIHTGHDVNASDTSHIRSTGMRALSDPRTRAASSNGYNPDEPRDDHGRWTTGGTSSSNTHPAARGIVSYGLLKTQAPSEPELSELRRQQAVMADVTRKLDIQNSWLAIPALAPPLVIAGLEGAALWAAGEALPAAEQAPLDFPERDPYRRVGDNWATRKGRAAHAALKAQVKSKDGWDPDPPLKRPGKSPLRPDAGTPERNPAEPGSRKYLELKPNTPSGRAAAARAVKRYQGLTKDKVRAVFYDPKKIK